ncbi:MAG: HEAT repeat domain-containing protein [Acidobacteriota bacterium]|nr:HEAT repeat domain-containing protein [Acidobacteriota bacterium]MDE3043899.1 HEAT repeat domain-containing protein [Acidobacteriota bacterium]MDE3106975.1 HEAT repeat domain-containing protein [Acidobacteriota bacterium]MDE3222930.1 HEAT repeat domain-containing protein [Acidobacteriota bacterium]
MAGPLGESPRRAVEALVERGGEAWVVERCLDVLTRGEVDATFLVGLSGRHAEHVLEGREGGVEGYWPRVWALRAMLYCWAPRLAPAVVTSLGDESWRVREMALRVATRREVVDALPRVPALLDDPTSRVRRAAANFLDALATREGVSSSREGDHQSPTSHHEGQEG